MDFKVSKILALVRGSSRLWMIRAVVAYISFKIIRAHVKWRQQLKNIGRMGYPVLPFRKGWLGSIPAMVENFDNVYEFRRECHERYGDTFSWVAPIWNSDPQVSTRDPRIVKHILQDNFENYLKSPMLTKALSTLLGNGIFAINHGKFAEDHGEAWYFQRKTSSKIFTKNQFTGHVHKSLCANTVKLMRNIDAHLDSSTEPLPMQVQFFKFTLDTIGNIGKFTRDMLVCRSYLGIRFRR
mmetsp:Transcript_9431/g.11306  ORF Transcript_9431/g.11306 Transcript_9431/m.11306 type:complete len:239 (-) Transcript_9431:1084-1800(-)